MKKAISIILFFSLFASTTFLHAGMKIDREVIVGPTYARGALSSARASSDTTQYIGCRVSTSSTTFGTFCFARDAAGAVKTCTSTSPNLAQAAYSLSDASEVLFFVSGGTCTSIYAYNSSYFLP